jgi:hypothetical protein
MFKKFNKPRYQESFGNIRAMFISGITYKDCDKVMSRSIYLKLYKILVKPGAAVAQAV